MCAAIGCVLVEVSWGTAAARRVRGRRAPGVWSLVQTPLACLFNTNIGCVQLETKGALTTVAALGLPRVTVLGVEASVDTVLGAQGVSP